MMRFRICRTWHIDSGHRLSLHTGKCFFPHGHGREVSVVLSCEHLNKQGMIVDFGDLKKLCENVIMRYDHAMVLNNIDPERHHLVDNFKRIDPVAELSGDNEDAVNRVLLVPGEPTTENYAYWLYNELSRRLDNFYLNNSHKVLKFKLNKVRVTESPTTWAEYGG